VVEAISVPPAISPILDRMTGTRGKNERRLESPFSRRREGKRELRLERILEAARTVFLEYGYAGASMTSIVEASGVSRATVYQYFGSKEGLMSALIEYTTKRLTLELDQPIEYASLEEGLYSIARRSLAHILSSDTLSVFRLIVAESGRKPEWGGQYYRQGPELLARQVTRFLTGMLGRGLAQSADPVRLASVFIGMLCGDLHIRCLFNPTRVPSAREVEAHIGTVVRSFVRAHGSAP
jgi:TetR/AcrR family transcriptional repressor of mexJK operon